MSVFSEDIEFVTDPPSGPTVFGRVGPLWKIFVAALDGTGISDLSRVAHDRQITPILNGPLTTQARVASDDPAVNIPYDDEYADPYLSEGTRLVWWFRRESETAPYYTVRGATMCRFLEDDAEQDAAYTTMSGFDPWHYMFSRPVVDADGNTPNPDTGMSFSNTQVAVIAATILRNTIDHHGHAYIDAGTDYEGTASWDGVLQESPGMEVDVNFPQGTTVGQAWQQLCALGVCDIVLTPIYDPIDRPNYLVDMSVVAQAGDFNPNAIFAWNLPGRSLVGLNRRIDGGARANMILPGAGQGAKAGFGDVQTDAASVAKYGEYWDLPFYPGNTVVVGVEALAAQQVALRAAGRKTVTFRPAPERSPSPWVDYNLGDRCPVWASRAFRELLGANPADPSETVYQRIYGWTCNISDDALETIDPVLTSPQGFTSE